MGGAPYLWNRMPVQEQHCTVYALFYPIFPALCLCAIKITGSLITQTCAYMQLHIGVIQYWMFLVAAHGGAGCKFLMKEWESNKGSRCRRLSRFAEINCRKAASGLSPRCYRNKSSVKVSTLHAESGEKLFCLK